MSGQPAATRRSLLGAAAAALLPPAARSHAQAAPALQAPNVVEIDAGLVTSGQPTRESLRQLRGLGFDAVLYLAPSSVPDAIADEPDIVRAQGLPFVQVPIPFDAPSEAHLDAVDAALRAHAARRLLVHCQINLRASTCVFLHRVLQRGVAPELAYAAVQRVWTPRGPWKTLAQRRLAAAGVRFEIG